MSYVTGFRAIVTRRDINRTYNSVHRGRQAYRKRLNVVFQYVTGKQYDGANNKTQHLDVVQRFFNSGDEDADDEVADADETTPALRLSRRLIQTEVLYGSHVRAYDAVR